MRGLAIVVAVLALSGTASARTGSGGSGAGTGGSQCLIEPWMCKPPPCSLWRCR